MKTGPTLRQLSSVSCPTCGVAAGKCCVLHSGAPRSGPHKDRRYAALEAIEKKMVALIEPDSDDEFVSSIAHNVMRCLRRSGYFEKLDDILSPEGNSSPTQFCDGSYKISESILSASGFDQDELDDIFAVLGSEGGFCDCEVLYNAAESSRLKSNYWRSQASGQSPKRPHAPSVRPN